jgi:hypothetical protein
MSVKKWRQDTKQRIIDAFDGKCCNCGYNKCHAALELHHLDPLQKKFTFGAIRSSPKSWATIVEELRKCVLLCANCHREFHSNLIQVPENAPRFNEEYTNYSNKRQIEFYDNCPVCGEAKRKMAKTCSNSCAAKIRYNFQWEQIDLYDLHINQRLTNMAIAEIVGCSDAAVIKRLKKLGIYKKF